LGGNASLLICPGWDVQLLKAAIRHDPDIPFISTVPLAQRSAEAYPRSWGIHGSPVVGGNMPYIQISDDVRSLAGAGA
jgi:hypothetical protein